MALDASEKAQCAGIKRDGSLCSTLVKPESLYCYWHDPDKAETRKSVAASGGKASYKNRRNTEEIRDIKKEIRELIEAVREGDIDRADASVIVSAYGVLRNYLEQERKQKEQDEFGPRLDALEAARKREKEERGVPPPWAL